MAKLKNQKKKTRGKIVKELDCRYSRYIRLSKSNKGMCKCITCGNIMSRKNIQNGHFIGRSNYNYRRVDDNCRPQDIKCNVFYNGNYKIYTLKMIDMFGRGKVDEMLNNKKIKIYKTFELEEMIEFYKTKSQELEKNIDKIIYKPGY